MYGLVMMMAMSGAPETPAFRTHGACNGCCGGYYAASCCGGGYYSACYGCCGGCYGGCCGGYSCVGCYGCTGWCFGCCGGCYGGCCGGYSSCFGCCGGCYGGTYSCCGGCCGGCYGGYCGGCCGGCYGGCYGGMPTVGGYSGVPYSVVPYPYAVTPATPVDVKKDEPKKDDIKKDDPKKEDPKKEGTSSLSKQATVVVSLPADAKLFADEQEMSLTSAERTFVTPDLDSGKTYQYVLRAEYTRGGEVVKMARRVFVRAGEVARVNFEEATSVATAGKAASVTVSLPSDAKLTVDGSASTLAGAERTFKTPALEAGKEYFYTLRAEVVREGKVRTQVQKVVFRAGEAVKVEFADLDATQAAAK